VRWRVVAVAAVVRVCVAAWCAGCCAGVGWMVAATARSAAVNDEPSAVAGGRAWLAVHVTLAWPLCVPRHTSSHHLCAAHPLTFMGRPALQGTPTGARHIHRTDTTCFPLPHAHHSTAQRQHLHAPLATTTRCNETACVRWAIIALAHARHHTPSSTVPHQSMMPARAAGTAPGAPCSPTPTHELNPSVVCLLLLLLGACTRRKHHTGRYAPGQPPTEQS
jgi:hypothetical protein